MRKYTEEMTCSRCGRKYTREFNDTMHPWDVELMEHPLCRKCLTLKYFHDYRYNHDRFMANRSFTTDPESLKFFEIIDKFRRLSKK